ncbi:MAG: YihY family inner membrane protein [Planctomycetota bacterium]
MNWFRRLHLELRLSLTRPRTQLTRGERFVRYCIDLARHARNELRDDSATTMAAALTYRTIFGFIPVLVMTLIVFKAFGGFSDTQQGLTDKVYKQLNIDIDSEPLPPETDPSPLLALNPDDFHPWFRPMVEDAVRVATEQDAQANQLRTQQEMRQQIDTVLNDLADRAGNISIGSIGVVGTLILIWAALGLIVTIEKTFNVIFKAPQGRPWHVRIPIYWAVITLGPVLAWGSFYLSGQLIEAGADVPVLKDLLAWLNRFMALIVTWLLFLLLFKLMPNARVAMRPAMIGAFVSALAWEGMKAALRWYIENAIVSATNAQLYGSLALIPLLLFWVYVTWLVVLAGLEVTHILQTLPAERLSTSPNPAGPSTRATMRDPWLVIPVMSAVAECFEQGETISLAQVAERLDAPIKTVDRLVDELTRRGLLHQLPSDDGPPQLSLALPPNKIRIADLIDTSQAAGGESLPGHALLQQLAEAQNQALADATLEGAPAHRRTGDG